LLSHFLRPEKQAVSLRAHLKKEVVMFPDLFINPEEKDPKKVKHLKQQRQDLEIRKHQGRITKEAYQVQLKQLEAKEEELRPWQTRKNTVLSKGAL